MRRIPHTPAPSHPMTWEEKFADWMSRDSVQVAKLGHLVGVFAERMCDGKMWMGYRYWNVRTVPRSMPLGRPPAPWCPIPWSKSLQAQREMALFRFMSAMWLQSLARAGQRKGWT